MGNAAVILHSIGDAEHCISNVLHANKYIFSTHAAIDVYLNDKYGISCKCLSNYWTSEDIVDGRKIISERVDNILDKLDSEISQTINDNFKLNMTYYRPLYSYIGKHHYSSYYFLIKSLEDIINKYKLSAIDIYDHPLNMFLNIDTMLSNILVEYFKGIEIRTISRDSKESKYKNLMAMVRVIFKNPIFIKEKIQEIVERNLRFRTKYYFKNKCIIILLEHLYNLRFLNSKLMDYKVLSFNPDNNSLIGIGVSNLFSQKHNPDIRLILPESKIVSNNKIDKFFINDVRHDFNKNIMTYLKALLVMDTINDKNPICLGIWGNSPIQGMKALITEYIQSKKRPVIGGQHGGIYGDCYEPWHFDSDFDRCDYFISFGFTESDLGRLYPHKKIKTKILPFGQVGDFGNLKGHKINIDILFPVTNSLSMLGVGMSRIPPNKLADRQIAILEYLSSLSNVKSYIKPFMLSNYDNCAVLPVLKRLQNITIVDYMPLNMFLKKYYPKIIIIEYPSTPLYETLHLDSEIFLLDNPVLPYEEEALESLKKRVHYFTEVDDMICQIDLYLKGKVPKKRDNSFLDHYLKKPNSEENILGFIENTINALRI